MANLPIKMVFYGQKRMTPELPSVPHHHHNNNINEKALFLARGRVAV